MLWMAAKHYPAGKNLGDLLKPHLSAGEAVHVMDSMLMPGRRLAVAKARVRFRRSCMFRSDRVLIHLWICVSLVQFRIRLFKPPCWAQLHVGQASLEAVQRCGVCRGGWGFGCGVDGHARKRLDLCFLILRRTKVFASMKTLRTLAAGQVFFDIAKASVAACAGAMPIRRSWAGRRSNNLKP